MLLLFKTQVRGAGYLTADSTTQYWNTLVINTLHCPLCIFKHNGSSESGVGGCMAVIWLGKDILHSGRMLR